MPRVLHIIDGNTPADMLDQLVLLAGESDPIVSIGPGPAWEDRLKVRSFHVPLGSPGLCALRMPDWADKVDIIHTWSDNAQRAGEILARGRPCTLVRSLVTAPPANRRRQWMRRNERSEAVWTVATEGARDRLIGAGALADRVHVLPPAAQPIDRAAERGQAFRAEIGLEPDHLVILAGGEMIRHGGHKAACWVHAILRHALPSMRLFMSDDGPHREAILAFDRGAGFVEEHYGPWPPSRRGDVVAACDIAMFCHVRNCGTTALAGALAAGLPTVIFGVDDLIECGGQAVLASKPATPRGAAQAIFAIAEDPALAQALADAGRQRAAQCFDVGAIGKTLATIYALAESTSLEGPRPLPV